MQRFVRHPRRFAPRQGLRTVGSDGSTGLAEHGGSRRRRKRRGVVGHFDLRRYVDPATGFISSKSSGGRELRAQELPGLWNGSMARWNTVFVDVPITTFSPVKVVQDLLRPQHQ